MAARIRETDWAATSLGPPEAWPAALRAALDAMLGIGFPAFLWWGPRFLQFRNDAAVALVGSEAGIGLPQGPFWGFMREAVETVALTGETIVAPVVFPPPEAEAGAGDACLAFSFSRWRAEDGSSAGVLAVAQPAEDMRLRLGLDEAADLFWIRTAGTLRLKCLSPAFERLSGVPRRALIDAEDPFAAWAVLLAPEDRVLVRNSLRAAREGHRVVVEYRILGLGGEPRYIREICFPLRNARGAVAEIVGIGQDLTAAKTEIRNLQGQIAEIQRSSRNTLAVIRSIARRTAAASQSVSDFADHLDGRIAALTRVQTALARDPAGVSLALLVADTLVATSARESREFTLAGPDIFLKGKRAETLGLALHELATNAVKFGALSTRGGRIAVDWRIDHGEQRHPVLEFDWVETLTPPARRAEAGRRSSGGFGTELLERTMAYELDAAVTRQFASEGLRCRIRLPLPSGASQAAE